MPSAQWNRGGWRCFETSTSASYLRFFLWCQHTVHISGKSTFSPVSLALQMGADGCLQSCSLGLLNVPSSGANSLPPVEIRCRSYIHCGVLFLTPAITSPEVNAPAPTIWGSEPSASHFCLGDSEQLLNLLVTVMSSFSWESRRKRNLWWLLSQEALGKVQYNCYRMIRKVFYKFLSRLQISITMSLPKTLWICYCHPWFLPWVMKGQLTGCGERRQGSF